LQPQLIIPLILKSDIEQTKALISSVENEESKYRTLLYIRCTTVFLVCTYYHTFYFYSWKGYVWCDFLVHLEVIVFGAGLCFAADVLFIIFFSTARSSRCVGRLVQIFAQWSDIG